MYKKVLFNNPGKGAYNLDVLKNTLNAEGYQLVETSFAISDIDRIIQSSKDCCGIIAGNEKWDRKAIDSIKGHIPVLVKYAVGVNNIDVEYATECGIPVYNLAGLNSIAVAEVAFIHILNALRKFRPAMDMAKSGNISTVTLFGDELDGKTVGIVGLGNIARNLIRMMSGFRVSIYGYDAYVDPAIGKQLGITVTDSMEELFEKSDIISMHIPLTKETEKLINRNLFCKMKENAIFVNTSRGGVVNEDDLYEGLLQGKPAYAGLDVVMDEPIAPDNKLLTLSNAYITPHFAACSNQAECRVQEALAKSISSFYKKEKYGNIVNPGYIKFCK